MAFNKSSERDEYYTESVPSHDEDSYEELMAESYEYLEQQHRTRSATKRACDIESIMLAQACTYRAIANRLDRLCAILSKGDRR